MLPSRRPSLRLILIVVVLFVLVFGAGIGYGRFFLPPTVGIYNAAPPPNTSNQANFSVFWEAWQLIHQDYADKSAINDQKMTYGAVSGMVDTLGDTGHTRFLTPDDLKHFNSTLNGNFVGIGVRVTETNNHLTVISPIKNSPAEKAGILAGDIIVSVDGKDVTALDENTAVQLILGQEGTKVTIGVTRGTNAQPLSFTMIRTVVETESVQWTYIPETQTGLIHIVQFDKNVDDHFDAAVKALRAKGMKNLLLDLRDDPGGLLDQSVKVADEFLDKGTIFQEQDSSGKRSPTDAKSGGAITDLPVVVLINSNTASAAEILTAALEQNGRTVAVVGEKTFGTGTVLTTHTLSDGSALLLGTQEWLTPHGEFIRGNGVTPTIAITQPADAVPTSISQDNAPLPQATLEAGTDAQLKKGLDVLVPAPK